VDDVIDPADTRIKLVAGLEPPNGSELVHEELSEALTEARETTADIAEALDHGGVDAAAPLVWEWRGVLFRVRLARIRLERPRPAEAPATSGAAAAAGQPVPFFAAGAVAVGSALVLFAIHENFAAGWYRPADL